jgi:pimeloyl-ACP methyl ester carboxylesterase
VLLAACILIGLKDAAGTRTKSDTAWAVVTGVITESRVAERGDRGFCPQVRYSYVLGSSVFHAGRVRSLPQDASFCTRNLEAANEFVRPYPVGKPVPVHYDPVNPEHATLEVVRATWLQSFPRSALVACFVLLAVIVRQVLMAAIRPGKLGCTALLALCAAGIGTSRAAIPPADWHHAHIHGHRVVYAVHGTGPTLVLLHGGGDSGEHSFERQLDVFSEHHRIVAPDQVGQGRTPDIPGPLSYTAMMEDTAELLKRLRLSHVDVMGFSDGGILGLMLAVRHPELVRRLIVSGVNIAPEGLNPEDLEELRATQIPRPRTIDEKLAHLWLTSPTETELNLKLLATITQPVLVISGDRDAITLEHTLKIFHALPNAELCVLPGTDHATFSGRSEWLNPIIGAFLDRT